MEQVPEGYRLVTKGKIRKGDLLFISNEWVPASGAIGIQIDSEEERKTWKDAVCRKVSKKENQENLLKKEAIEFIMLRLSGTYIKGCHQYQTVEKALYKLSQEELAALSAMVLTVT